MRATPAGDVWRRILGAGWPLHGAGHVTPQLHPTVKVIDALLGTDNTSPAPWAGAWSAHAVA